MPVPPRSSLAVCWSNDLFALAGFAPGVFHHRIHNSTGLGRHQAYEKVAQAELLLVLLCVHIDVAERYTPDEGIVFLVRVANCVLWIEGGIRDQNNGHKGDTLYTQEHLGYYRREKGARRGSKFLQLNR